jgi:iron complex outermembrane receptor protein
VNIGSSETEGLDVTFNYRLPETQYGTFSFQLDNSYLISARSDVDLDGQLDDSVIGEYQDRNNNWRLRSNLAVRWEMGDFGATLNSRYYSRQEEDCQFMVDYGFGDLCSDPNRVDADGNAAAQNMLGGTTYHDLSAFWKAPWDARVTVGINNVGDKEAPKSYTTFANSFDPAYDVPGRFYYVQYNQKF